MKSTKEAKSRGALTCSEFGPAPFAVFVRFV
jgi:hypothetical protein